MCYSVTAMQIDRRHFLAFAGASLTASQLGGCGTDKDETPGVPRSIFDDESTAEQVTAGVDLTGKLAVVTGCTSGIGFETMRVLAKRGAYVVGTSRSLDRAKAACRKVIGITTPVQLDLGDFESVVACADSIRSLRTPIDMLVCNAGYLGGGNDRELINGIEKHFVINHLGHFILVNRLLDRMFLAWQGRIVVVASRTAYTEAPDKGILFDDLSFDRDYDDFLAYGHSKLANVLFSLHLAKLLRGTRVTSNSLHPGVIDTGIGRHFNAVMRIGLSVVAAVAGKSIEQGAATSCYLATSDIVDSTSGAYFEDCNAVTIQDRNHLYNKPMAEELVRVSAELTADYLVEPKLSDWENLTQ